MVWHRVKQLLAGIGVLGVITLSAAMLANYVNGGRFLSVQSGSMVPALKKGDLVSVKRVPHDGISVGDVITFINPADQRTTITHRVVAINPQDPSGNTIVTKGDANSAADSPIEARSVVGRVTVSVPYAGHVLDFLRTWPGLILVIYLPALMIIVGEGRRLAHYFQSKQPYVLEGYTPMALRNRKLTAGAKAVVIGIIAAIGLALPARAALQQAAVLTGNTITINGTITTPPSDNGCTITNTGAGSTNTCTVHSSSTTTISCSGSTTVTNTNSQTVTSGPANATDNNNGGNAASGNVSASNTSSTSVTSSNNCQQ